MAIVMGTDDRVRKLAEAFGLETRELISFTLRAHVNEAVILSADYYAEDQRLEDGELAVETLTFRAVDD